MLSGIGAVGRSRLWPALLGWVAGSALQLQQAQVWSVAGYTVVAISAVVMAWCLWRWLQALPWRAGQLGLGAVCVLAAFAICGWRAQVVQQTALPAALEGKDLVVQGVIAGLPQVNETGVRFRWETEQAWLDGRPIVVPPLLQLGWYSGVGVDFDAGRMLGDLQLQPVDLRAGERWVMTVRLKAPHGQINPFGFDAELWLWEQGVQATGYVRAGRKDAPPRRLAQTWRHPIEWARQAVRDAVFRTVAQRSQAGLIAALVVGDQNAIDRADWDTYRRTGVAHLLSISGLHITMFAWIAMAMVGAAWRRSPRLCLRWSAPSAAWVGGLALAGLYALFSGWGIPAQRTVWMLLMVGGLRLTGRRWPWPLVWLTALAWVVAWDPWALTQAGFWLSFVAVGVLFASDLGAPSGATVTTGWRVRLRAALREQWILTVALAPLSLLLFHQVSVVGLVANLLAVPWVTLVLTPLSMLGVGWPVFWLVAGGAAAALEMALKWLAAWPWASVTTPAAPLWVALAAMAGALLLAMPWPWRWRALGVVWLWPALTWQTTRPDAGQFEMWAPDIGQGNAVLIRTATHSLLYDAGPSWGRESDAGHRVLVPWLQALQEPVHTLVLSHRDADHTGGAPAVLAMQTGAQVLGSLDPGHPALTGRDIQRCVAGQRWDWDGVTFEVLHPTAEDFRPAQKSNALSCVLRVGNGRRSVLLAGDIEAAQEWRLVQAGQDLRSDVLLVPHHGSKTSSSAALLDAVAPKVAVVQSGYRNRFGHPAVAVMDRYALRSIRVYASPACGAFQWRSAAPDVVECERTRARRYWHHVLSASDGTEDP